MPSFTTIKQKLEEKLHVAVAQLHGEHGLEDVPSEVSLQPPKQAEHGDYAANIALALAKKFKQPPRVIATKLQEKLGDANGLLTKTEVADAGFLNLFVSDDAWRESLAGILAAGPDFIKTNAGRGERVLVEFVSANPTGPLHIAHGRGAVTGDVICNMLAASGYKVEREYYVNDLGNQCDIMARSIYLRYGELFGREFVAPEDFYPGEYIGDIANEIKEKHGDKFLNVIEDDWLPIFRDAGIESMLVRIKADLESFGVRFDRFVSERELTDRLGLTDIVSRLKKSGHIYEEDGKKWFRTTDLGDDKDRVVVREDGRPTYFASDILYHDDKMQRGFKQLIDIWGADHGGYIARVKAAMVATGWDANALDVLLVQMVSLSRGGEAVRMGKRLGTAVWLREVISEAGCDATRYFFIMRRSDAQLDFDLELAAKKSLDNPVYYAQMGHARMCSIARRASSMGIAQPIYSEGTFDALVLQAELNLIKMMALAPEVIRDAALLREPHRIVHYVQELIAQFHSYYTKYKNTERVISDDPDKTKARLLLCRGLQVTLKALLEDILGVQAPEQMAIEEF
ncbi:MAG: arginine--tRNA ligase [Deltaproteobacteria bacterium]|nr:arginine--tRNA ligase [Deltaproteobacteria bacterium]